MRPSHAWRVAWIAPRGETLQPTRLTGTAVRLAIQVVLMVYLWRALYAVTPVGAGLDRDQAIAYVVLAVLIGRIRGLDRFGTRDNVLQHVEQGTILYWFTRPVSPARYYLLRSVGDQLFGLLWAAAGFLVGYALGVITPPASSLAGALFLLSMLLGQVILYYLSLLVDLLCFWLVVNDNALRLLYFLQALMSGAVAPLWFFPGWLRDIAALLPFQAILHIPLSVYVGAFPVGSVPGALLVQCGWCGGLAALTGFLWRRAATHLSIQGG